MPILTLEQRVHKAISRAVRFEGVCFRNVKPKYANPRDILSPEGSLNNDGRYNFKGAFGVLYLSCDAHTCLEETTHAFYASGLDVAKLLPRTIVGIAVRLSTVLDLTDYNVRRAIGINKTILTGTDWASTNLTNGEAITQSIGRFAKEAGFESLLVPSAVCEGKNLDIFLDNLRPSSAISAVNESDL